MEPTPDLLPELFEPVRGRRARRHRDTGEVWQLDMLHADLAKRLANLTVGLTVAKVLRLDDNELVIEFEDGTRLLARGEQRLDVSIT